MFNRTNCDWKAQLSGILTEPLIPREETLHEKIAMPDLQRYPWNLNLVKYEFKISFANSLNYLFSFVVSLRKFDLHISYSTLYESEKRLYRPHFYQI